MKRKILLLILTSCFSAIGFAQTTAVSLEFEAYLVSEGIDLTPNSGDVLISRIDAVQEMIIDNTWNISSIELSFFASLEKLDITENPITSISFPDSPLLEEVFIRDAPLANIDVSNNAELLDLRIYGSNLTTLNISQNLKLTGFAITNTNTLTTDIDFMNNNALTFITLGNVNLTNVSIENKPSLVIVDLNNSTITNLKLENLPLLNNLLNLNNTVLTTLEVNQTGITSLNLSSFTILESIICNSNTELNNLVLPPDNSPLKTLEVFGGKLVNFDIENRPELENLTIFDIIATSLTVENLPKLTSFRLEENFNLTNLRLAQTALTSFNGLQVNNRLLENVEIEANPNLQNLPISSIEMGNLERLSVVQNDLTSLDISRLTTLVTLSVRNNSNLTQLDLKTLQDGATPSNLDTYEGENTGIEELDFSANPIIDRIFLAYNMAGGVPLKTLNLKNGNNVGISELITTGNYPSLSCIEVDASTVGTSPVGWVKDSQTVYAENCNLPSDVSVSFVMDNDENLEDDGMPTPQLVLNGTVSVATTISVLDVTSGSASTNKAEVGTDYQFNGGSPLVIQIPVGIYDSSNPIAISGLNIFNDDDYEGGELIVLSPTSSSLNLVNATDGLPLNAGTLFYSYTILEDDYRVDISEGPDVTENGSNSIFTVILLDDNGNTVNNDSGGDILVSFLNKGDAMEGVDFTFVGSTLDSFVIPNGQSSSTLTVVPINDNLFEDGEFIDLEIVEGDGYYLDFIVGIPFAGISILDNDNRISFSSTRVGLEGGDDVAFTITLSDENGIPAVNDTPFDIEFGIGFLAGTGADVAVLGTDFIDGIKNSIDKSVFILSGQESVIFEVEVIDDSDSENQENFITTISDINQGLGIGIVIDNNQAVGLINDNDGGVQPPIFEITPLLVGAQKISDLEFDYAEGTAATLQLAFDFQDPNATAQNFGDYDFQITTVNGTAIGGDPAIDDSDFATLANETVTLTYDFNGFPLLDIGINDDALTEDTEFFYLDISENETGVTLKNADVNGTVRIKVNIIDNEPPPANVFEITPLLVGAQKISDLEFDYSEGTAATLQLAFDFQDPNATSQNFGDYDFQITTVNGTAIGGNPAIDDSDFATLVNETVTLTYDFNGFPLLDIGINDDALTEDTEFFYLDISENETGVALKNADVNGTVRIRVNIIDNEPPPANVFEITPLLVGAQRISDLEFDYAEGTAATLQLAFDFQDPNATSQNFGDYDFQITTVDGTAIGGDPALDGSDFATLANETVTLTYDFNGFPLLDIGINDDMLTEDIEFFYLDILENEAEVTLKNADVNGTVRIKVNIIDNEPPPVNDNDGDGILNADDNCIDMANADQANMDGDAFGDVCDDDIDGDGVANEMDAFPYDASETIDTDSDGVGDNADTDDDDDGVLDGADACPGTVGVVVNSNGCPLGPILNADDIEVLVQSTSCPDVENGSFLVIVNAPYTFDIRATGGQLVNPILGQATMADLFFAPSLAAGSYEVCLTVADFPDFEQCFNINVLTHEYLSVDPQGVNISKRVATFVVRGSKSYNIKVNSSTFTYDFNTLENRTIEVPLADGNNEIQITGVSDCQGIFTDEINIGHVVVYPNPVINELHFTGLLGTDQATIVLANAAGIIVKKATIPIYDLKVKLNVQELSEGIYFVFLETDKENIEFKIVKNQ